MEWSQVITTTTRLGWVKFRECNEILLGRRFPLKMQGRVYRSCVRSVMLYDSETWCLRENELEMLKRTERAMVRAMCGVKLMDKKNSDALMNMLGLEETLEKLAKANGVRWYGHILRKKVKDPLQKALLLKIEGTRGKGRPKKKWKMQVEEDMKKCGMKREDAQNRLKWRRGVKQIASRRR